MRKERTRAAITTPTTNSFPNKELESCAIDFAGPAVGCPEGDTGLEVEICPSEGEVDSAVTTSP